MMNKIQKNIIFDLGAVMVDWNPQIIAKNFTDDIAIQTSILQYLFHHDIWIDFDKGLISEVELISRTSPNINLSIAETRDLIQQAKQSLHAKQDMVDLLILAKEHLLNTYCLSNLSHEWFEYLIQRHDFFNLFDGKVISAQEGIGKPNIEIYKRMVKRYHMNSERTLFIDDRAENTQAASSLGIQCVTFEHSSENLDYIQQFIITS